jgi:hypothetical protein
VYVPRPITASEGRLSIEFVPRTAHAAVFIKCGADGPEPLCLEGGWRIDRALPDSEFTFAIGTADRVDGEKPHWIEAAGFRIPGSGTNAAIAGRFVCGPLSRPGFGVFVPLVALHAGGAEAVGDFGTMVEFAEWAKRCGIGQIHVAIERIAGQLIDPVHARVRWEAKEISIAAIRDSKIEALRTLFVNQREDEKFAAFCRAFRWIKNSCRTEFGRWVQFFLFGQLAEAYKKILEMGIQLVINLDVSGTCTAFFEQVKTWAHYAQTLQLTGMDLYCSPVRREVIEGIFGKKHTPFIITTFCEQRGDSLSIPNRCKTQAYLAQVVDRMGDPALAGEIKRKLEYFLGFVTNADTAKCRDALCKVPPLLPAALLIDPAATEFFGPKVVTDEFRSIAGACSAIPNVPTALMPNVLAPDMVSEFPENVSCEEILAKIRGRANDHEPLSVTVYLCDLLAACGGYDRHPPPPIQLISGHCRFALPLSLQELQQDQATISRIYEILSECKRVV